MRSSALNPPLTKTMKDTASSARYVDMIYISHDHMYHPGPGLRFAHGAHGSVGAAYIRCKTYILTCFASEMNYKYIQLRVIFIQGGAS